MHTFPYIWAGDDVRDVMHGLWGTSYLLASAVGKQTVTGNLPRFASPHHLITDCWWSALRSFLYEPGYNWQLITQLNLTTRYAHCLKSEKPVSFRHRSDSLVCSATMPEHPVEGLTHSHAQRWNFCSARLQKSGHYLDWEIGDSLTIM